jgi:hypothetical protein
MASEGKGQPAHKDSVKPRGLGMKFGNSKVVGSGPHSPGKNKDGLSGYTPGKGNIGPKMAGAGHPMAHSEVHHATHGGHKGHLGEHKLCCSNKISERPMGAFKYHEVFGKKAK